MPLSLKCRTRRTRIISDGYTRCGFNSHPGARQRSYAVRYWWRAGRRSFAAVIRALDGRYMNGRLLGASPRQRRQWRTSASASRSWHAAKRWARSWQFYCARAIWRSDNVIFSATGITKGDLLEGISRKGNIATTETLLIRGKSAIAAFSPSTNLDRKDPENAGAHPLIDLID